MEDFKSIIENDEYLITREKTKDHELRLYLREVDFHCPLCGKELQSRKQKKLSEKRFQVAHIYPNSPTEEQYNTLKGLERLGENCESFENKIALCKDCHGTQDFHTQQEEYVKLLEIKKKFLRETALHDATLTLGLEQEIEILITSLSKLNEGEVCELSYSALSIDQKFHSNEIALKSKIRGYVLTYFIYIRDFFNKIDGINGFNFEVLSMEIKTCFIKMVKLTNNKAEIFNNMVLWIKNKTQSNSIESCEAVISFFIQHCEVFYEITK
ncbi:ABC-three component system protein [uncultured Clostridium sp.]|uniref:ABC-three component system protein n=1 Tax=uncultured Clostridium sp. TaxID=59620 RepID=UPI003217C29F